VDWKRARTDGGSNYILFGGALLEERMVRARVQRRGNETLRRIGGNGTLQGQRNRTRFGSSAATPGHSSSIGYNTARAATADCSALIGPIQTNNTLLQSPTLRYISSSLNAAIGEACCCIVGQSYSY